MRKKLLILTLLVAFAFASIARPASASVEWARWISPLYRGSDNYLGTTVIAYSAGSTAKLLVNIHNGYGDDITRARVTVHMSWAADNETWSDDADINDGEYHIYELSIRIPAIATASNLYTHSYTIYFKHVEGVTIKSEKLFDSGSNIAVYDADQTEIVDVRRELDAYPSHYTYYITTAKAKELMVKAGLEESLGVQTYEKGDFAGSKTHYQNALNYTSTAISADVERSLVFEDSQLGYTDALKNNIPIAAYGALMFGFGFVLIGIGVIIYAFRKPKSQVS